LYGAKFPSECIPCMLDTTEDTVFKTTSDRQLIEDLGKESPLQKWFYSACLIVTPKDCLYQWVYEIDEDFLIAFISKSLLGEKRLRELNEVAFPSKDALLADRYLTFYFQNNENALSSDCLQELFSLATSFDLSRHCSSLYDCLDEFESVINTSQFLKWSVEALLGLILLLIPSRESVFFLRIRDDLMEQENNSSTQCLLHKFLILGKGLGISCETIQLVSFSELHENPLCLKNFCVEVSATTSSHRLVGFFQK
jgi:hypothetical protein